LIEIYFFPKYQFTIEPEIFPKLAITNKLSVWKEPVIYIVDNNISEEKGRIVAAKKLKSKS
jgi:hypothetical protein